MNDLTGMDVAYINLSRRICALEDGTVLPMDQLFDCYGEPCDADEAVVAVVGPVPAEDGTELWISLDLADFTAPTYH